MTSAQTDPLLYGHNTEEGIVAVQHLRDNQMRIFRRTGSSVQADDQEFFPFFFLEDPSFLGGFGKKHWIKELSGPNHFRAVCAFTSWSDMWEAVNHLVRRSRTSGPEPASVYTDLESLYLRPDPVSQFLMQSGRTLFKGMALDQLLRLRLSVKTYATHGPGNPSRPDDRILVAGLSDSTGWSATLDGGELDEGSLLRRLVALIRERDPDVIEGHNIIGIDLPYILKRCALHAIDFAVGREGSSIRTYESRAGFGDRATDSISFDIPGRHIVDTLLLLQHYDAARPTFESYSLRAAAQHFGFTGENRIHIRPERISWYWDHEPALLIRSASEDAQETGLLSDILSPPYFHLTQMLPYNYGTVTRLGASAKIESLLVREYLRQRVSIPKPEEGTQTTGGYTDIFMTGVLEPIVEVDVESLYPSIMLMERIAPKSEPLGVFLRALELLTELRLTTKRAVTAQKDLADLHRLDAMQSALKILINSFYGYLGYFRALFNDFAAADRVTRKGQEILRSLIAAIESRGGTVVEADTDGIFFVPPPRTRGEEQEKTFVESLTQALPDGIRLAPNGRYKAMLSYKKKNYALLGYDQKIRIRGSSLNSRSMERFARNFLQQCIDALLNRDIRALHEIYVNARHDIAERKLVVTDFARTEALHETREVYEAAVESGARKRAASYEVALEAGLGWKPGDRISYYITGNDPSAKGFESCKLLDDWNPDSPDENTPYYLRRLDEFARKLEVFFAPHEFRQIFSADDLFPFTGEGIRIKTAKVIRSEESDDEGKDDVQVNPRIWLDEP